MNRILFIILFISSACNIDYAKENVNNMLQADTLIYTQQGTNVTIKYTDSGYLKAVIFAKKLVGYKNDGNEIIKMPAGINADFYNPDGEKESHLSAEQGISYQTKKITEVSKNVVVINKKGEKLNTEKLIWDQNQQKIYTNSFVKITTQNEIITGEGLTGKQDFSEWTILKPRGVIQIEKDTL